jgi:hypothetical protein
VVSGTRDYDQPASWAWTRFTATNFAIRTAAGSGAHFKKVPGPDSSRHEAVARHRSTSRALTSRSCASARGWSGC